MENESKHPVRNVKCVVGYRGENYAGWQVQDNEETVQSVLENSLSRLAGVRVKITGSGRTDAGVHALAQVFNVKGPFAMDDGRLLRALNSMLPDDISVSSATTVNENFNALRDSKSKLYRYYINNSGLKSAWTTGTSWFMPVKLDHEKMKAEAKKLEGRHDFASFVGKKSSAKTTVRNIISTTMECRTDGMIVFEIRGEGFLKQMVRNIVGTLVEIGRHRHGFENMEKIIEQRDRRKAGPTAPGHGLFLVEVEY